MEIMLKNGENIKLDWNPIVLEYLEDYDGGIKKLKEDIENGESNFRTFNFVIYSMLSAVYPSEIGYREAVGLVNINDYDRIIDFVVQNVIKTANIVNLQENIDRNLLKKHIR